MTLSQVEQAARNNAIWCDTICRAHGVAGEFHEAVWFNRNSVPRFYPNTVVGLFNLFAPAADSVAFGAGCVATAQASFSGLPLVGYESGADLARAEAVGFDKLQPLRVWGR